MRFLSQLLLISSCVFQHTFAKPKLPKDPVLLPINDPFYVPDDPKWESEPRGTILDKREVTIASLIPGAESEAKAYQLLYVTQDLNEKPQASVTTIIVPKRPRMNRVISLQNAYDSPDPSCAPSYGLQYGAEGWSKEWNQMNLAFLLPYLQGGPVLNIPDYEGNNAAFAVGPQSAYQTLDSIRAAIASSEITGIEKGANYIMFGYSGGALATEWATELKREYADDLPIVGAIMGGPPTNISQTYHNVNNRTFSQLNVWAMLGLMNAFPEMDEWMRGDLLKDAYQDKKFLHALTRCSYPSDSLVPDLANTNISALFHHGDEFLTRFKKDIDRVGIMGQHITKDNNPGYPLAFFYGREDDVIAPISDVDRLITKWKDEAGVRVFNYSIPLQDHMTALGPGLLWAWPWMNLRFANVERHNGGLDTHDDLGLVDGELDFDDQLVLESSHELR
jgi:triacylglycerol lipase